MALTHPVAVYNAKNNIEAELICTFLESNGVEAYVTLDESVVGCWMFGVLPEIHKPQVWIDQSNVEAARPLLIEYEREASRRQSKSDENIAGFVDVVCEDCGKVTFFPSTKLGTVQDCSHCGSFVDVGEDEPFDWSDS